LKSVLITHNHIDHTRALKAIVGNENLKVERYIDHGMREGPGTGNPNWVREEKAEGNLDITIREIEEKAVLKAAAKALADADIDPVKCDTCDPKIRVLHGRVALQSDPSPRPLSPPPRCGEG